MIGLDYGAIVQQIKASSDVFAYVAFSATPQQINWLASNPVYPAAFVSPAGKDAAEYNDIKSLSGMRAWITEHFSVLVMFENKGDLLSQTSIQQVPLYRETLRTSVVNWHPLPVSRTILPVMEGEDALFLFEGGARTGWLFNYSQRYQIMSQDCWQPVATKPFSIELDAHYTAGS